LFLLVLAVQLLCSSTYKQRRFLTTTGFSVGKRPSSSSRVLSNEDAVRKSFVPFTKLIDSSKISGNWTAAIRSAEEALLSLTPSIATGVIRVFGESGDLGRAIGVLSEMKKQGISPNERHYGVLIQCCKLTGQWDMAMELFHRMKSQNVPRSTVLCNILLSTVAKSNQGRYIEEILTSMREDRVEMDTISYSSAIFAFTKCNQPQDSLRLWDQLLTSNAVVPNTILVNNVLHACNSARMWERCTDIFNKAVEIGVNIDAITLSNCIIARAERFDFDGAQRFFNMTRDHQSTVRRDVGIYNAMILACERTRRSADARSYISRMRAEGIQPDHKTYSSAISCCGKAGDALGGLELIQEMKSRGSHSLPEV
jgi:pentatricopeptide repeat protein